MCEFLHESVLQRLSLSLHFFFSFHIFIFLCVVSFLIYVRQETTYINIKIHIYVLFHIEYVLRETLGGKREAESDRESFSATRLFSGEEKKKKKKKEKKKRKKT